MINVKYIDKSALLNNLDVCKKYCSNIIVMVKADAYGHGVKTVVKILKDKVKFWGVANTDEALNLRKFLDNTHTILVVGKSQNFGQLIKNNIDITIDDFKELIDIKNFCIKNKIKASIHIAINTGMNRIGVKNIKEFKRLLEIIKSSNYIKLKGVFTHCFDEDSVDNHFDKQMAKFKRFVDCVKDKDVLVHIGGSFCLTKSVSKFVNMVRVGYFLYGYGSAELKPVMTIESKVVKITHCKVGEFVGYGKTKLSKDSDIALIPLGYADGIPFNFADGGYVYIKNKPCPVLGRICMDMLMVDVTNIDIKLDDKVTIFDNAEYYAKIAKTLPYEILTNFSKARTKTLIK